MEELSKAWTWMERQISTESMWEWNWRPRMKVEVIENSEAASAGHQAAMVGQIELTEYYNYPCGGIRSGESPD